MILLAVVHQIPEKYSNLSTLFDACQLNTIPFDLTGDFSFLMPIFGLNKGCGGSNPCPICVMRKTTAGGQGSRWVGETHHRTLGSLYTNYAGWVFDGMDSSAAGTRKWESVCESPLISIGQGRKLEDLILKGLIPGPLHLFLSWNEIVNFLEKTDWPEIKMVLRHELGVKNHVYQGKVGNYEGPSIHKVLRNLHKLEPYMPEGSKLHLYYNTFVAFKDVAGSLLSTELSPQWRAKIHQLRHRIIKLHTDYGMNISPKLHILIVHVEEWVDMHGRSLGKEGEQHGESVHHHWRRLLETVGHPKVLESPAYINVIMKCLLIFNSNNV